MMIHCLFRGARLLLIWLLLLWSSDLITVTEAESKKLQQNCKTSNCRAQPDEEIIVALHKNATFPCRLKKKKMSLDPIFPKFYFKNKELNNSSRYTISGTELIIHRFESSDVGNYSCGYEDSSERLSATITLLNCKPKFSDVDRNETIRIAQYQSKAISCRLSNYPPNCPPPNMQFFFNDKPLKRDDYKYSTDGAKLVIRHFDFQDVGSYRCLYENEYGSDQKTTILIIKEAFLPTMEIYNDTLPINMSLVEKDRPYWSWKMLNNKENVIVKSGERRNLTCYFYKPASVKKIKVKWKYRQDSEAQWKRIDYKEMTTRELGNIAYFDKKIACPFNTTSGQCMVAILDIKDFDVDRDRGQYQCIIRFKKHRLKWTYTLTPDQTKYVDQQAPQQYQKKKISISISPNSTVCLGSNNSLRCDVSPRDEAIVMFMRLGKDYDVNKNNFGKDYQILYQSGNGDERSVQNSGVREEHSSSALTTKTIVHSFVVDEKHGGQYMCSAGFEWKAFNFKITTLEVIKCGLSDAELNSNYLLNTATISVFIVVTVSIVMIFLLSVGLCIYKRHQMAHQTIMKRVFISRPNTTYIPSPNSDEKSSGTFGIHTPKIDRDSAFSEPFKPTPSPLIFPEVRIQTRYMASRRRFTRTPASRGPHSETSVSSVDNSSGVLLSGSEKSMPKAGISYEFPLDPQWEFPRERLVLREILGSGAFGTVWRGEADGLHGLSGFTTVAVKMLKIGFDDQDLTDLVKEMEIMKVMDHHPHLIRLHGTCTQRGPLLVLTEFAPYGNLRDFLRQRRRGDFSIARRPPLPHPNVTVRDLLTYSHQVAEGMDYLSSKSIVHRDLAARNILVGRDFCMKIADFGMTRSIVEYYKKTTEGRLPVKWLAPESLMEKRFTTKSDVWSFGILMWEIFSFGATPYPSVAVEHLFVLLRRGHRNEQPLMADGRIYELMNRCWKSDPAERPTFPILVHELNTLYNCRDYDNMEEYIDMRGEESGLTESLLPSSSSGQGDSAVGTQSSDSLPNKNVTFSSDYHNFSDYQSA